MITTSGLSVGLHRGLSMADYLALPFMSASRLEAMRRSPRWFNHQRTAPPKTSDALERGTALHLRILEPALYETRYVVAEPCVVPLKSGPRKDQACGNPGLFKLRGVGWACGQHLKGGEPENGAETITADNDARVKGMAKVIEEHPRAKSLFEGRGEFEATIIFEDPDTGVLVRVRPDRLVERAGMYVALKTTRDATPEAFAKDAENRGYFRSFALYRRAFRAIGWPYSTTAVLAVESEPPYDAVPYLIDEADIDGAEAEVTRLLRRFKDCEAEGRWPGVATEFLTLRRPRWATQHEEV